MGIFLEETILSVWGIIHGVSLYIRPFDNKEVEEIPLGLGRDQEIGDRVAGALGCHVGFVRING